MQATTDQIGWPYRKLKQLAHHQFGPGSTVVWLCQVRILEHVKDQIPNERPGLVGSDDFSKWTIVLDFQRAEREGTTIPASSGHAYVSPTDFPWIAAAYCEMHDGSESKDSVRSEQELDDDSGEIGEKLDLKSEIRDKE